MLPEDIDGSAGNSKIGKPQGEVVVTVTEIEEEEDASSDGSDALDSSSVTFDADWCANVTESTTRASTFSAPRPEHRGCRMSKLLLHTGLLGRWRLWRAGIDNLPDVEKRRLHAATEAAVIDVFISHTWNTSGLLKMLHLQLRWGWSDVLLLTWFGVLTLALLQCFAILPQGHPDWAFDWIFKHGDEWSHESEHITIRITPYCCFASFFFAIAGLLVQPLLPQPCRKDPVCFLDAMSICQYDEHQKRRGIRNLETVLVSSQSMCVLWSEEYLTRIWCIYELAAFLSQGNHSGLTINPLFIDFIVIQVLGAVALGVVLNFIVDLVFHMGSIAAGISNAISAISVIMALVTLRRSLHTANRQLAELADFDVRTTHCKVDSDRQYVEGRIISWYGSIDKFNDYVRSQFQETLVPSIAKFRLPYSLAFLSISACLICAHMDVISAVVRAQLEEGKPNMEHLISVVMGLMCRDLAIDPIAARLLFDVGGRITMPISGTAGRFAWLLDSAFCIVLLALFLAARFVFHMAFEKTQQHGLGFSFLTAAGLALLTYLVFRCPCQTANVPSISSGADKSDLRQECP